MFSQAPVRYHWSHGTSSGGGSVSGVQYLGDRVFSGRVSGDRVSGGIHGVRVSRGRVYPQIPYPPK